MAVTSCDITRDGISIEESKRYAQTYSARYQIETDSEMGPIAVQSGARSGSPRPVPAKGDYFDVDSETDLSSFALDFRWSRDPQNKFRWFCDVTWRPLDPGRGETSISDVINTDPLAMEPVLWWEIEEYTKPIKEAKVITNLTHVGRAVGSTGPLINAAGDPFDIVPEIPASRSTLVIQKNWENLDSIRKWNDEFANKLNSGTYRNAPARTLLAKTISSGMPVFDNGVTYYTVQLRLVYEPDEWKHVLTNAGMKYLTGTWTPGSPGSWSNRKEVTTDSSGAKIVTPRQLGQYGNLDWDGDELPNVEYEYGVDEVDFTGIEEEPA